VKVLIVLGAGASYDVHMGFVGGVDADWRPPLATGLFDLRKLHYYEKARPYAGAEALGLKIAQEVGFNEALGIEAKLREFAQHKHAQTRRWFRDLPPYLRDLLHAASSTYVAVPEAYLRLVEQLAQEHGHEVGFVTLNYDTLLEQALVRCGYSFPSFDSYVLGNSGPVVKLHGSVNWFVSMGSREVPWHVRLDKFDPLATKRSPQFIIDSPDATHDLFDADRRCYVYPALTAPMAGKDPDHFVCPEGHVRALRGWARDCRKLLVVGTSGKDENLLRLLNSCLPDCAVVHYVGGTDTEDVAERFSRGLPQVWAARDATVTFGRGFAAYLSSPEFTEFLKNQPGDVAR